MWRDYADGGALVNSAVIKCFVPVQSLKREIRKRTTNKLIAFKNSLGSLLSSACFNILDARDNKLGQLKFALVDCKLITDMGTTGMRN